MEQKNQEIKKYKFYVEGMHCASCVVLTESELQKHNLVDSVRADLHSESVEVFGNFNQKSEEELIQEFSDLVKNYGYKIIKNKEFKKNNWADFKIAFPLAFLFIILFIFLQKLGIVNLLNVTKVSYGSAFLIGIIASLSTCMAVVGGLLLSLSANFAKEGKKFNTQLMFHFGRLLSFFVFGGIIGMIGSVFTLSLNTSFVLGIIISLAMLILGLNLLNIFSWSKKMTPLMPKFITDNFSKIYNFNNLLTPFLTGVATFFLPCGFTQAMQVYTLSVGNFWQGSMIMFIFALGTLPVLGLISFGSFIISKYKYSEIFFKTVGLVVIFFALFNIINSLVIFGLIPPIFNF